MPKINGPQVKENKDYIQPDDVCSLLFQQIDKPTNYKMCRAFNVYENKYRINIYTHQVVDDIPSQRISHSYFVRLAGDGTSLEILMKPSEPKKKYK